MADAASGEDETFWGHKYALEYDGPGTGSWSTVDSVKWYSCDEDIAELSKHFPGVLFELSGDGEENNDTWSLWARDGRSYKEFVEVVYPVFDEAKLT